MFDLPSPKQLLVAWLLSVLFAVLVGWGVWTVLDALIDVSFSITIPWI